MKKISKIVVLLAVAPLAAFSITPDQPASTNAPTKSNDKLQALFADAVVAKGKGLEVKRNDLDSAVVNAKASYAAANRPAPEDLEVEALRTLIIKQLVLDKATDADRAQAKENFESRLAKVKAANGWSDEEFNKRIGAQLFGQTRDQWEKQRVEDATVPVVMQREMGIKITDQDVRKFYDDPEHISDFEKPETVRASHILLMTTDPETHEPLSAEKKAAKHQQMEDILKQARAGTNFAELAKKYSEDPGSKDKGGEYTFPRGQMVKEFEDTAFSMKPNEISDIIETRFGYHIIKLSEKIPAKKVDFDQVKDQIKDLLVSEAMGKQSREYAARLEKDAHVEVLDENLKAAESIPPAPTNNPAMMVPAPKPAK